MIFYRVLFDAPGGLDYSHHATLAEAHCAAKAYPKAQRECVVVELIDVPTDREGILDLLRGYSPTEEFPARRTWTLSVRGGLRETTPVPADEAPAPAPAREVRVIADGSRYFVSVNGDNACGPCPSREAAEAWAGGAA